ncbi:uncharacterized protein EAF02_006537 [Botrytis sinoallii]|uniref:uncharacterized protein n=1 Tax=Botrytis sinoallii TaxID=1463999 RepID=UPI001900BD47|nr:uncharacterized protein EAF02_006537 [Botrytis sinoallii]KAF7881849.1 hypothetical protein EAF02_006537 [Botrytis sinoallii]
MFLRRGEGKDSEKCRFEEILRSDRGGKSRTYTMGWSIPPNGDSGGVATTSKGHVKHCDELAEATQLIAKLQSEIDVSYTAGDEENRNFSTIQVNYSNVNTVSLSVEMGKSGSLHIDAKDDPARIARHPHLGIPPRMMGDSPRKPYVAPIPNWRGWTQSYTTIPGLVLVAYPQRNLMNRAPTLRSYKMPDHYKQDNPMAITFPHGEAFALAAWGTLRHQHEKIAMQDAWHLAHRHSSGSLAVLPSAKSIAKREAWKDEDGHLVLPRTGIPHSLETLLKRKHSPDLERLQKHHFLKTTSGNDRPHTDAKYVSVLGSSLIEPPKVAPGKKLTKAATHAMFGENPYLCSLCDKRIPDPFAMKAHFKTSTRMTVPKGLKPSCQQETQTISSIYKRQGFSSLAESSKKGGKRRRMSDSTSDEPPAQKIKAEDPEEAIVISDDE